MTITRTREYEDMLITETASQDGVTIEVCQTGIDFDRKWSRAIVSLPWNSTVENAAGLMIDAIQRSDNSVVKSVIPDCHLS